MQHKRIRHAVLRGQRIDPAKLALARQQRRSLTAAEAHVWHLLRGRRFEGTKWRRQQVIAGFIADFYCAEHRIVLEVDGQVHGSEEARARDEERTAVFNRLDIQVARITNDAVKEPMLRALLLPLIEVGTPPLP